MYYPIYSYNIFQPAVAVYYTVQDNSTVLPKQLPHFGATTCEVPVAILGNQLGDLATLPTQHNSGKPSTQTLQAEDNSNSEDILADQIAEEEDSEFNPKRGRGLKRKRKCKAKENQNRNVIPNLVHHIFSFLFSEKKSTRIVKQAFKFLTGPLDVSICRFYQYQAKLKDAMNHYVNQSSLAVFDQYVDPHFTVYSKEEQDYYLKVSRVVARHFLRWLSPLVTLTSRRISSNKKLEHIRTRRILMHRLDCQAI